MGEKFDVALDELREAFENAEDMFARIPGSAAAQSVRVPIDERHQLALRKNGKMLELVVLGPEGGDDITRLTSAALRLRFIVAQNHLLLPLYEKVKLVRDDAARDALRAADLVRVDVNEIWVREQQETSR